MLISAELCSPLLLLACLHRMRAMSLVHCCLERAVAACRTRVWFFALVLLLNQISNLRPLSPLDSVRPMSAVCNTKRGRRQWVEGQEEEGIDKKHRIKTPSKSLCVL